MVYFYFVAWIILLCAFYIYILTAVHDCCSPPYYWTGMSFKYTFLFKKNKIKRAILKTDWQPDKLPHRNSLRIVKSNIREKMLQCSLEPH